MENSKARNLKKNSFIQGTLISSLFFIIIKIMGALYVIPFYKIIGERGGTLYSYAYNIYNLFLNVSTAGIPVAMSMIISEYIALDMYDAKERARSVATKVITLLAIISFFLVFFGSPYLARFLLSDAEGGHSVSEVSLVIKVTAFCLLIIPFLSVLRGYLQGHKYITITSFSQVIEQIVRIIVVLIGSFVAVKVLGYDVEIGVCVALTGAFFGGLFAYIYLVMKMRGSKEEFAVSEKKDDVSNKKIFRKIVIYCIPLVIIAMIDNIYTLVDIRLIVKGLNIVGYSAMESQTISGIVATWAPKICTIIIAISLSLTTNIIPHVTTSYVKNDHEGVNYRINQAVSTMIVITVPMAAMLFLLSDEAYYIFYGDSRYGAMILSFSAFSHLFLGMASVFNSILQSMKKFKIIYINTSVGLLSNALLDIPVILLLDKLGLPAYIGTILATCIGYIISIIIVVVYLKKYMKYRFTETWRTIYRLILPTALMVLVVIGLKQLIVFKSGMIMAFVSLMISGFAGSVVYLVVSYKDGALKTVFGDNLINALKSKMRRR